MNYTSEDILHFLSNSGMLDLATIQEQMDNMDKQKYLDMHKYTIWIGKDGQYYTYLYDIQGKRKMVKRPTRKQLDDIIIQHYKANEHRVTMKDIFEEWVTKKLEYGEILKQTYDRYRTDFIRFFKGQHIANIAFDEITEEMLEDFIKRTIHEKELTAKAWGNLRTIIKGTFKLANKKKQTDIVITLFLNEMDISPKMFKKRRVLDDSQVFMRNEKTQIKDFVGEHQTLIGLGVLLAFETGLRCGELAVLQPSDIHGDILYVTKTEVRFKDGKGHYIWEIRDATKGRDGCRKVVLTEEAIRILKEIRRLNPFGEFLFMKDGERVKGQAFSRRLKTICRNVKIDERSIHKARKTYATNLLNAGVDEKIIQKQMGHTSINTTREYYYFDNHETEEVKHLIQNAMG